MLANGTDVSGYRIERLLGRGGMGEVYEATQLSLQRRVALKILRADVGADEAFRERFRREGRIQAGLDHPNIVPVYEAGEIADGLYIAMKLVRGPTLKDLIRDGEIDPARTVRLLGPLADALDAAHARGLVHRDVKPQNILIAAGDVPFLADFGLTKGGGDTDMTQTGQFVGTLDYIAPEVIRGEPATAASDVYAFGCVLFECLTGRSPYARGTEAATIFAHLNDAPPEISRDLGRSADVEAALAACLAKEPDERPVNARRVVVRVARALGVPAPAPVRASGESTITGATPVTTATDAPPRGRRPWPVLAAASAVVLLAGGAYLAGSSGTAESDAAPLTVSASGAATGLRAPAGWQPQTADVTPAIPGLVLRDGVALAASSPASGVVSGLSDAHGPGLLPPSFKDQLVGDVAKGEAVRLGRLQALRYSPLRVRGFDRELAVYAVPATTGVATVACYAPSIRALSGQCRRVAQTLELKRGRPLPLNADPDVAGRIDRVVETLRTARARAAARARRAGSPAAQATAARDLRVAYARAASRLENITASPAIAQDVDRAAAALKGGGLEARRLAAAASRGDGSAYRRAAMRLRAADRRFDEHLLRLERAGYRVK